ncbi:hypothetical protein [Sulfurimonas sp.]
MGKMLIVILSLSLSLFGFTSLKELKYESGISIYGKVGFVDVTLEEDFDNKTYKMEATASSTGVVKVLTRNRSDIFTSEGNIVDGVYVPTKFTKKTLKTDYEKVTTYTFDYENDTVKKAVVLSKYEVDSTFDLIKMKYIDTKRLVVEKSSTNIELHKNDFLSLYLNLKHGNLKKGAVTYIDKKDKDSLSLVNNSLFEVHKNYGEDKYNIALIDDKKSIFFQKAVSINVSFYGDAYIEKISERTDIIN